MHELIDTRDKISEVVRFGAYEERTRRLWNRMLAVLNSPSVPGVYGVAVRPGRSHNSLGQCRSSRRV